MLYFLIISYIFLVVLFNIFVIKRMKYLSNRHKQNTWIESLSKWYRKVKKRLIILSIILVFIISLLFLTFIKNELLWKKWLHIDEKTLGNNSF